MKQTFRKAFPFFYFSKKDITKNRSSIEKEGTYLLLKQTIPIKHQQLSPGGLLMHLCILVPVPPKFMAVTNKHKNKITLMPLTIKWVLQFRPVLLSPSEQLKGQTNKRKDEFGKKN